MSTHNTLLLGLLLLLSIPKTSLSTNIIACECEPDTSDFGDKTVQAGEEGDVIISPEEEVVDSVSYGKLISIRNIIFAQKNMPVKGNEYKLTLVDPCPTNYRPITKEELQIIADTVTGEKFSNWADAASMNFEYDAYYFTSTNKQAFNGDVNDRSNYDFWGMVIRTNSVSVALDSGISTKWDDTVKYTKCVFDPDPVADEGLPKDLIQFVTYFEDITRTNVIDYQVVFASNNKLTSQPKFSYAIVHSGCSTIKLKWKMFNGQVLGKCLRRIVVPYTGSSGNTLLSIDKIFEMDFETKAERQTKIHRVPQTAPIAPKSDGGAYIVYSELTTKYLKVIEVDNNLIKQNTFDLNKAGDAIDFQATPFGFVLYARSRFDPNLSYIEAFDKTGKSLWRHNVMKNGPDEFPSTGVEQFTFHNSESKAYPGMEVMFKPTNGKIAVGRNRIVLIFGHWNYFGNKVDGSRDDREGESIVSMDYDGNDLKLIEPWLTEATMAQKIIYNEEKFVSVSLGNKTPMGLNIAVSEAVTPTDFVDPVASTRNRTSATVKSDMVAGHFPADTSGNICGRLGGLMKFYGTTETAKGDEYGLKEMAFTYVRWPCEVTVDADTTIVNSVVENTIVFFNQDMTQVNDFKFSSTTGINMISSLKYGANILILMNQTTRAVGDTTFLADDIDNSVDTMFIMLLDNKGNPMTNLTQLSQNIMNADRLASLSTGAVVWAFVDTNNNLKMYKLPDPPDTIPIPNNPDSGITDTILDTTLGNTLPDNSSNSGGNDIGGNDTGGNDTGGNDTGGADTGGNNNSGTDTGGDSNSGTGTDTGGDSNTGTDTRDTTTTDPSDVSVAILFEKFMVMILLMWILR